MQTKIMMIGVSGVGKTTLALHLSKQLRIPFVSGSYSDLVPETRDMPHRDMISQSKELIVKQDWQVINLRHRGVKDLDSYISDRSYIDSIGYWLVKLSGKVTSCETLDFVNACSNLAINDTNALIYIPFDTDMLDNWNIEDNQKRILSRWYQYQASSVIDGVLTLLNYQPEGECKTPNGKYSHGYLHINPDGYGNNHSERPVHKIPLLILNTMVYQERVSAVEDFLKLYNLTSL